MTSQPPVVFIREVFKVLPRSNPKSGHKWHDHGPTTGFVVVGPHGVVSRHRILRCAEKAAAEWRAFYTNGGP